MTDGQVSVSMVLTHYLLPTSVVETRQYPVVNGLFEYSFMCLSGVGEIVYNTWLSCCNTWGVCLMVVTCLFLGWQSSYRQCISCRSWKSSQPCLEYPFDSCTETAFWLWIWFCHLHLNVNLSAYIHHNVSSVKFVSNMFYHIIYKSSNRNKVHDKFGIMYFENRITMQIRLRD